MAGGVVNCLMRQGESREEMYSQATLFACSDLFLLIQWLKVSDGSFKPSSFIPHPLHTLSTVWTRRFIFGHSPPCHFLNLRSASQIVFSCLILFLFLSIAIYFVNYLKGWIYYICLNFSPPFLDRTFSFFHVHNSLLVSPHLKAFKFQFRFLYWMLIHILYCKQNLHISSSDLCMEKYNIYRKRQKKEPPWERWYILLTLAHDATLKGHFGRSVPKVPDISSGRDDSQRKSLF